jgi:hypothetical protein
MIQLDTELNKRDINAVADIRFVRKMRGYFIVWLILGFVLEYLSFRLIKEHLTLARIINWLNLAIGIAWIVWYFVALNKNRKKVMQSVVKNSGKMEYKAELDLRVKRNKIENK